MERFQNVEAVLMLSFCMLCAGATVLEPRFTPRAVPVAVAAPQEIGVAPMITIVVTGKRLTAAQKHAAGTPEAHAAIMPVPAAARAG